MNIIPHCFSENQEHAKIYACSLLPFGLGNIQIFPTLWPLPSLIYVSVLASTVTIHLIQVQGRLIKDSF